ncbi:MAG: ABC transporter permease, partial [Actinobacteria bacterium]|nr:ABC transporter permease [Actinomycetota bacterium]
YVVGVFCFSAIGLLLASLAPTARAAQSVGLMLRFVMLFVSGTSAPLGRLPSWMVWVGKALPLYHSVIALVDPWIGRCTNWMQLAIAAAVGMVATW